MPRGDKMTLGRLPGVPEDSGLERRPVDIVCSGCGSSNAAGAQFCSSCRAYLGWQEQPRSSPEVLDQPPLQETEPPHEPPDGSPPMAFRASIDDLAVTVPVDGTPVQILVDISNMSTIVDGYVVEAVNAPAWLEVVADRVALLPGAHEQVGAQLRVKSRTLIPAQGVHALLRVRNTTGSLAAQDLPVEVIVPAVDVAVELRAEPSLVRVIDLATGACTIVVDNSHGNTWVQVRMSAIDPEGAVEVDWSPPKVQVAPGGQARTEARFAAPPPAPGGEVSRTITVAAKAHRWTAVTTVTLVQVASRAPMEFLELQLEPAVLRLGGKRRGQLTVTADNRRGARPVELRLRGADAEDLLGFAFRPAALHVGHGQQASAQVTVTAPRTPAGNEVTRAMRIVASDGRYDVRAEGSVIQFASSRRGLARVVLTVLGALFMFFGSLALQFVATGEHAVDLSVGRFAGLLADAGYVRQLDTAQVPGDLEQVASVGLVLMVLAGVVLFGLTGSSGRLTRYAAVLAAVVVVVTLVGWAALASAGPGVGAFIVLLCGCVLAYAGGFLAGR